MNEYLKQLLIDISDNGEFWKDDTEDSIKKTFAEMISMNISPHISYKWILDIFLAAKSEYGD